MKRELIGKDELKHLYEYACNEYARRIGDMYGYDCEWIGDEPGDLLSVSDDIILNMNDVKYVVDNNVGLGVFIAWYYYNLQINYGVLLGHSEARKISLYAWHHGFPDHLKVPQLILDDWEREYFKTI